MDQVVGKKRVTLKEYRLPRATAIDNPAGTIGKSGAQRPLHVLQPLRLARVAQQGLAQASLQSGNPNRR